ncbi:hypothetical protein CTT34_10075 [Vreelandella aquamarina]|uniref:Uncharacterized protein n=1 Tax=Vreelandella aquamarina TaxID=77097 RepID=A0A857GL81_9GAMM|nr:hypothetical protein CTT34_10075 [Halomonas meridiana]
MTHQPKGSLCMACRHTFDDCSRLPFSTMPAMSKSKGRVIVRCTEFEHARPTSQRQADRRAGSA